MLGEAFQLSLHLQGLAVCVEMCFLSRLGRELPMPHAQNSLAASPAAREAEGPSLQTESLWGQDIPPVPDQEPKETFSSSAGGHFPFVPAGVPLRRSGIPVLGLEELLDKRAVPWEDWSLHQHRLLQRGLREEKTLRQAGSCPPSGSTGVRQVW